MISGKEVHSTTGNQNACLKIPKWKGWKAFYGRRSPLLSLYLRILFSGFEVLVVRPTLFVLQLCGMGKHQSWYSNVKSVCLRDFDSVASAYWPAGYPQNDWEHFFAMQHFGMPPRLLDWTENLLIVCRALCARILGTCSRKIIRRLSGASIQSNGIDLLPCSPSSGESIQVLTT